MAENPVGGGGGGGAGAQVEDVGANDPADGALDMILDQAGYLGAAPSLAAPPAAALMPSRPFARLWPYDFPFPPRPAKVPPSGWRDWDKHTLAPRFQLSEHPPPPSLNP